MLTSHSGSLASDLFWPEIWGDLVNISCGGTEREQIFFFLILHSGQAQVETFFYVEKSWVLVLEKQEGT